MGTGGSDASKIDTGTAPADLLAGSAEWHLHRLIAEVRNYTDRQRHLVGALSHGSTAQSGSVRAGIVGTNDGSRHATALSVREPDPFADLFAAISNSRPFSLDGAATLPPSSRFMVRVAKVGKPHRTTKRNYDYFGELNVALEARALEQHLRGDSRN